MAVLPTVARPPSFQQVCRPAALPSLSLALNYMQFLMILLQYFEPDSWELPSIFFFFSR